MKRILLISFMLLSFVLSAQNQIITDKTRVNEIKVDIIKSCNGIDNMKCKYVQEKSVSLLKDNIKNEGEVIFMTPDNLYWKNNTPENQLFVLRNDSVKIINNDGINIMPIQEHLIFREVSKFINNAVLNSSVIDEDNFISSYEENDNYIIVNMKPKKNKMRNLLGDMRLYFDKTSVLLNRIEIIDKNSDVTTIMLSDIYVNHEIDNTLFNF